ncbi:MAG: hypothetical protein ACE5RO_04785 [Candidatus Nitrosomaritimum yanchengensis]
MRIELEDISENAYDNFCLQSSETSGIYVRNFLKFLTHSKLHLMTAYLAFRITMIFEGKIVISSAVLEK